MDTPLIEFQQVTKRFGTKTVLDQVNLKIYEGEVTTIIGLSGSGKSVLLKHIIGLLKPEEGTILFRGRPLRSAKGHHVSFAPGEISYMFQNNALFDSMNILENVSLPLLETTNMTRTEIEKRALARLEQTDLVDSRYKFPSELSGGMQKRVALARALIMDPKIVLFDEPTSGQDPIRKNAILSMIAQYQRKFGFTAILVSHEIPDVYFISNRILALYDKKIVFQGTPEELEDFDHPFNDEVIRSLEGLQAELTGLSSRRRFKVLYRAGMKQDREDDVYALIMVTLQSLDTVINKLGHEYAQMIVQRLGIFIDKHFGPLGGFSTRYSVHRFVTVLPYTDLVEARDILKNFVMNLSEYGIDTIIKDDESDNSNLEGCTDFAVLVGLAQGRPFMNVESVVEAAAEDQKEISRLSCPAKE
ncbi:MAG: ATP-binding cassette domain-containing protein [Deltaproteobacteria bacterium]|nr:ATP-binding cassette domain-containing protein [Deltaproteobacteria bacterium]